ncbi:alpha/beta hydrolase [Actinosynnema pretiosum subsp. pretiosum]|uniref:Alpha/beta hydrolase n=1 Tax=Actinosynnema pretiosum subsp. pretiosum TaxID=103721 RepID=A0AA45L6V2_9PSEU|nr:N-formylglutamate deformylase [Actinosynnema pretiosum subsp. pretiosum]QUF04431.1 alpha/beta hydrolase [Actinosynnema pretiosum subsp. pretiosum]
MIEHHEAQVNGTTLHYVRAGDSGSPILLVHGFPETWWAFHRLIPLLAARRRVFAVDLRGFGDSAVAGADFDAAVAAEDLHALIGHLGVGAVHVLGQDLGGGAVFRLAALHPRDVLGVIAVETALAGFGFELLTDVARGGAWHIGVVAAEGVPELLLRGREREFLRYAFGGMAAAPEAITEADLAEFARTYARPGGWSGAAGLYRAALREGEELRALAEEPGVRVPVLAVGAGTGGFTADTMTRAVGDVVDVRVDGVGHWVALEAPERLAEVVLGFTGGGEG